MLRFVLIYGAFLCLALPAYAQNNSVSNDDGSHRSAANTKDKPANGPSSDYLASIDIRLRQIARLLDSKIASDEAPAEQSRSERDVRAQERMADWGPWMFGLGLLEVFITALGVRLVLRTLKQSRADTEDDIRPYVQISRCKFEFARGAKPRFVAKVQNSGQTPATFFEVSFIADAIAAGENGENWKMPDKLPHKKMWNALGGGDDIFVSLNDPGLTEAIANVGFDSKILFVFGKVRYGDVWRNEYETEFVYWLRDVSPTMVGNTTIGIQIKPRQMSRATGALKTFQSMKLSRPQRGWFGRLIYGSA